MKRIVSPLGLLLLYCSSLLAQQQKQVATVINYSPANNPANTKATIARLEKDIPRLLKEADVPGMSIALVRDGQLVWTGAFGVINTDTKKPVNGETVFEAASLSKPVFAYAVMKLVDEGKLNLDTPLNKYLGNNYDVVNDERINLITARRVLSLHRASLTGGITMVQKHCSSILLRVNNSAIPVKGLCISRK